MACSSYQGLLDSQSFKAEISVIWEMQVRLGQGGQERQRVHQECGVNAPLRPRMTPWRAFESNEEDDLGRHPVPKIQPPTHEPSIAECTENLCGVKPKVAVSATSVYLSLPLSLLFDWKRSKCWLVLRRYTVVDYALVDVEGTDLPGATCTMLQWDATRNGNQVTVLDPWFNAFRVGWYFGSQIAMEVEARWNWSEFMLAEMDPCCYGGCYTLPNSSLVVVSNVPVTLGIEFLGCAPHTGRYCARTLAERVHLIASSLMPALCTSLAVSMDANGALNDSSTRDAATFAARQVALGRKSFGFSQPVLGVHPMTLDGMHRRTVSDQDSDMSFSGTTSPMGSAAGASASDRSSHHHGNVTAPQPRSVSLPNTQIPQSRSIPNGYQDRPPPVPPKSQSATHDGLPRTSNVGTQQPPPSRMSSNNMTSNGTRPPSQRFSSSEPRAQTLPSRKFVTTPNNTTSSSPTTTTSPPACRGTTLVRSSPISSPPPNTTHTTASTPASPSLSTSTPTSTPRPSAQTAKTSASLARDRSLHLRLASLPPPMMARYNTQGSARLTPSVVVPRPMPMPLLNLPTLPPSTPSIPHSAGDENQREGREGRRRAPLRSMPALPLTGPRDDENPDMDEEGSDEDSEEGEGEDDHYHDTMRDHDEGVSEDEMDLDIPSPQLPLVDTSPLGISLSFIAGRSAAAQQRLREIEREAATLFSTPPSISAGVFSPSPLSASFSSSSRRPATATGVTSSASASGLGFASSPVSSTTSRPSAPTASSPTFPPRTSSLDYFSHKAQSSEGGSWSSTPSQDVPKMEDTSKTPRPSDFLSKTPLTSDSKTGKEADYDKTPHTVSSRKTQFLRDAEEHGASKESSDDEDGALLPKIIPIPPTPNSSLPPSISSRSPTSPGRILGRSTVITPPVSPPPSHPPTSYPPSAFQGIPIPPSPGPESAYRPGLYHHVSKSMVDLTPYARKSDKMKDDLDGVGAGERYRTPLMDSAISEVVSTKDEEGDMAASASAQQTMVGSPRSPPLGGAGTPSRRGTITAQLRRQRSLPTYSPATVPPPYPAFLSQREEVEEGYCCFGGDGFEDL
ncbi:hypothetical protein NLI96_g10751 [Meripilus lineatus]|uniref:Uncharacterized protein n=1 Tax=Meripilus lineatus TaxID=2056292 RepID=A0AAD5YBN7_9APHY|nr:hypothetical protein NLI96_g10751 [Physisporinus lineatus]